MENSQAIKDEFRGGITQNLKGVYSDFSLLKKAFNFAESAHKKQYRKYSGRPYLHHPLKVARILSNKYQDMDLIIAAILHDTVEDNDKIGMEEIYKTYGEKIGFIVDAVTANILYFHRQPKHIFKDKLEKLLYGGIQNIRCILLKLADREHNLITLHGLKPDKQIRMSFETQAIYEPLKQILNCKEKNITIGDCEKKIQSYIAKHNINSVDKLRENLYEKAFSEFDDDTFLLVYKNSKNIIWRIEDQIIYKKLIELPHFDDKIEVLSLENDTDGNFCCIFKYKKGEIFEALDTKIKIQNSEFIS